MLRTCSEKILRWRYILTLIISLFFPNANAQQSSVIIPKPVSESSDEGVFHLSASTIIVAPDSVSFSDATVFSGQLKLLYNIVIKIQRESKAKKNIIRLTRMEHRELPDEYLLVVYRSSVLIEGRGSGIFYGLQSLLQLI